MVRYDTPLFLTHNAVFLFLTHQHLLHRIEKIFLGDTASSHLHGVDRRLVYHICQIGTYGSAGCQRNFIKVHRIIHQHILRMYFQDFHTPFEIRLIHNDPPVETSRAKQRLIQNLRSVSRRQNNNAALSVKSVHLGKQLVQRLLPLLISAAVLGIPASSDRVNLIDEHDTGRILLRFPEQVSHTGSSEPYI